MKSQRVSTRETSRFSRLKPRKSLPQSIADIVAQAIAARTLDPGTRIVETSLAAELGVSRVPVREALKILHTQGIIDGGGHRGYRIAAFSETTVHSVQEARIEIERLFLREAVTCWRAGTPDPAALDAGIEVMRRAALAGELSEMLRADVAFHTIICEAAQNPILSMLWMAIARHVLIILNLARFRDTDLWVVVRRHEALRDQIHRLIAQPDAGDVHAILQAHFLAKRPGRHSATVAPVSRRANRRPPLGTSQS